VIWVNDDGAPHSIAMRNGVVSETLTPGASFAVQLDRADNYDYLCSIHPYMTGKIVVTERRSPTVPR
jgi:plastocyanin